jgi:hypothetical protein
MWLVKSYVAYFSLDLHNECETGTGNGVGGNTRHITANSSKSTRLKVASVTIVVQCVIVIVIRESSILVGRVGQITFHGHRVGRVATTIATAWTIEARRKSGARACVCW